MVVHLGGFLVGEWLLEERDEDVVWVIKREVEERRYKRVTMCVRSVNG